MNRYNKLGEWKPLVYQGDVTEISHEIVRITNVPFIQGVLLYIKLTGIKCIEFAIKTKIDFPIPQGQLLNLDNIYLYKCPPNLALSDRLYDGTLFLDDDSIPSIASALDGIDAKLKIISLACREQLTWRTKYQSLPGGSNRCAKFAEKDFTLLDKYLAVSQRLQENPMYRSSVEWFNMALIATSPLISYLCLFISIESLAIYIAEGKDNLSKEDKNQLKIQCIKEKHDLVYSVDPRKFVREAYFDCEQSLKIKLKTAMDIIYGKDSQHGRLLFEKKDGYSLHEIRSCIAHGDFNQGNPECLKIVNNRISELENLSHDFISRLLLDIGPEKQLPGWSNKYQITVNFADPRTTLGGSLTMFANKDWSIKSEWIDQDRYGWK